MKKARVTSAARPHVVILGAGFAGAGVLKKLKKVPVAVTLVDRNDYHTSKPLLYQVATLELEEHQVGFPVRDMISERENWFFRQAEVLAIDLEAKSVFVQGSAPISYDYLVLGLGAVVNFFGTQGAAEHALPLYNMADATRLKSRILEKFAAANQDGRLVDDGALVFCVVGGGPTGVETAGALSDLIHGDLAEDYPNLPIGRADVHLYERGPELLTPFKPSLRAYAKRALEERGVRVHVGEGVAHVERARMHLTSGGVVKAHTVIWGAGLSANPLVNMPGVALVKGRIPVGSGLNLEGHAEVFVVGDNAIVSDGKGKQLPQLGSVAMQAGEHVGASIGDLVRGKTTSPFVYRDKGTMATIGYGAAVVQMPRGMTLTGEAAWLSWLGVHLILLSGGKQKGQTLLDWGAKVLQNRRRRMK